MSDYFDPEDEAAAAQDRIDRIRRGGSATPADVGGAEQGIDDLSGDAVSRARARARTTRAALVGEEPIQARSRAAVSAPAGRGRQAIIVIGGVVGIGVVVLVVVILATQLIGGGGPGLFVRATATPTPTETPIPSPTPTETPTPTPKPPDLQLPGLGCYYQSGVSCYDYCQLAENVDECDGAKRFVGAQGADPDVWFQCIAPGPGVVVDNPQQCLIDAWYAAHP